VEDFIKNFEESIDGVTSGEIKATTEFRKLDCWDSLAVLSLLVMIDRTYHKQLDADALRACVTINDIYKLIA
jgi:acyl carrier protein